MRNYWLCFISLFVAVDAIGLLPLYLGLTEGIAPERIRRIIAQSIVTATVVALTFVLVGDALLKSLGINVADFMIAGGLLLFAISLADLITVEKIQHQTDPDSLGAVPLGVPLLVGPAVFTTSILLINQYGVIPTTLALLLNLLIAGLLFLLAGQILRILGKAGSKTLSKLAALLLAAIAVMMVRKGIQLIFTNIP